MTDKKSRDRVIAEITLSRLIRLGAEQGRPVSREQALTFLNQEGRAFEMWKHADRRGFHCSQLVSAILRTRTSGLGQ
jgi:hypothetical protein